jgi:hypothetical protein
MGAITKTVSSLVKTPSTKSRRGQPNTQSARETPNTKLKKPLRKSRHNLQAQKARVVLKMRETLHLARLRELEAKEEALRWKHKTFLLEQKMAKMSANPIDRPRTLPRRPETWKVLSTDLRPPRRSAFPQNHSDRPDRTSMERPQPHNTGDPLPSHKLRKSARRQSPEPEAQ